MRVSKVEIVPIRPKEGLIGFATVEIDKQLLLHSVGIHCKRDGSGYRLTYPTRTGRSPQGPIYHPIEPGLSREIEECIFGKLSDFF